MKWDDQNRTLIIGKREGQYPGMLKERNFHITVLGNGKNIQSSLNNSDQVIIYKGKEIRIKM